MDFSYSVNGKHKGSAESVDFQGLQMKHLSLDGNDYDIDDDALLDY